jgi:hypothetical protein
VINGQTHTITINEDNSYTINFSDLNVTDPDNTYPDDFTLIVLNGQNYSVNSNTITPQKDYYGTLKVPVKVNDGNADSNIFNITINVNPVNDAPTWTKDIENFNANEDFGTVVHIQNLTTYVDDVDNSITSLNFKITYNDKNKVNCSIQNKQLSAQIISRCRSLRSIR